MIMEQSATCLCGERMILFRGNARKILGAPGAHFAVFGGVCLSCGRGTDMKIERKPSNEVRRAR